MQTVFTGLLIALLSAIAAFTALSLLGNITAPLFGYEVRAAVVVLCVAVAGVLFGVALAVVAVILELRDGAVSRRRVGHHS